MYLPEEHKIWLAYGETPVFVEPEMANRHGLIAGATGTGKTVTLKVLAESFSEMGVPVFLADIKGDVTGMCQPGVETKHIRKSLDKMGLDSFSYTDYPVQFFDVYGKYGHPVRTTISEMGPDLLSRLLTLNDVQTGILHIVFRIADEQGLLLLDLKDLRSMVQYVGDHAADYKTRYGNITSQSVGAIQRALLRLEEEGGDIFFGEPALDIADWFVQDEYGYGMLNILECAELFQHPLLYATFLLWMLSSLYDALPEAGDLEQPKIAFFFDEAHLLFKDAPKALLEQVERIIRLIRSKGVSIWFITQQPSDIPDSVLSQLGNRIQHALRAYTPNDQKAVKAAANSFRANPSFQTVEAIQSLGVGEALVSTLDEKGIPNIVQYVSILPPRSSMNAADPELVQQLIAEGPLEAKYRNIDDRWSAFEELNRRQEQETILTQQQAVQSAGRLTGSTHRSAGVRPASGQPAPRKAAPAQQPGDFFFDLGLPPAAPKTAGRSASTTTRKSTSSRSTQSTLEKTMKSAGTALGKEMGRQLARGILGTFSRR